MSPPHGTSPAIRSARTQADQRQLADVSSSEVSLLRRREIGLYPLILVSIGSFALSLSQALRPATPALAPWEATFITLGSLVFGLCVGTFAVLQERRIGRSFLGTLWFYGLGAAVLLGGLATVAVLDSGLSTVAYTAVTLVAAYVGLVFPLTWSRIAVAGLIVLSAVIQAVRPEANLLEAGTVFALILVGWLIGLMPRLGHRAAAVHALLVSRSDPLSGAMNRRGFLEEFAYRMHIEPAHGPRSALLAIDLNGFKQVNDELGHAAGDELLAWVGQVIAPLLPAGSAFGRLGGDEFAVVVPGRDEAAACGAAEVLRHALAEQIGASFGVATPPPGQPTDDEAMMRAADRALYAAKADPTARVQHAEAAPSIVLDGPAPAVPRPQLTYDELRRSGNPGASIGAAIFDGRWVVAGFVTIAAAGVPIVINALVFGGHQFFDDVLRYLGIPWVLTNLVLGLFYWNADRFVDPPRTAWWLSAFLVAVGVGAAALADGAGITSPIMAAYPIKALFDSSMGRRRLAFENLAILLFFWAVTFACGPADARWAAPYVLLIMGAAHVLGAIGRDAFESGRSTRVHIAHTDSLTGLLNRRGFDDAAVDTVAQATEGRITLAVISFDLDDFKGINDTQGHAAGDQILRSVSHLTRDVLPDAYAIGRTGGDEFVALVPSESVTSVARLVSELDEGLAAIVGGSVGYAIFGEDGTELDPLLVLADQRAYAVKESRPDRHRARGEGDSADATRADRTSG